jgi:hypothetical protein
MKALAADGILTVEVTVARVRARTSAFSEPTRARSCSRPTRPPPAFARWARDLLKGVRPEVRLDAPSPGSRGSP